MKKFLIRVSLFSIFILLLLMLYEFALMYRPNEYSYKRKYVEEHGNTIKVLVLGHSQAAQAIMPSVLSDSAFNFAIEGRPVYYDAEIAKRYIPTMKKLKCVIWPLGYNFQYSSHDFSFSSIWNGDNGMVKTYRCMYYKYMDIPCGKWSFLCWPEIMNSKFEYGRRFFTRNEKELINCNIDGFDPNGNKSFGWEKQTLPGKYTAPTTPDLKRRRAEGVKDMKTIAKVCRDNGVRLVIITTPAYKTYQEKLDPQGVSDMLKCVDEIRSVYHAAEYHNYMFDKRFTEDDFFNSSHLTVEGAKKFTGILKKDFF